MAVKRLTDKTEFTYSKMRWKDKDYARLNRAWNKFNKKVPKTERLPYFDTKQSIKSIIYSRQDYDRAISVLESINKKGAFKDIQISKENEKLTLKKWQYDSLRKYDRVNQVRFHTELNKAYKERKSKAVYETNVYGEKTLVQRLPEEKLTKLESYVLSGTKLENLSKVEDKFHLTENLETIIRRGSHTFDVNRDIVYKENYMKMFEGYENLDNYEEVTKMLNKIEPKEFYSLVKEIDEEGSKLFDFHYDNRMIQEEFNQYYQKLKGKIEQMKQK